MITTVSVAAPTLPASSNAALITALQAADPEPAIEQAHRQIATRGGDVPLLLSLAAAMVRAGLGGLADLLLRAIGAKALDIEPIRAVLAEIARVPSGEISRQTLRDQFDRNIARIHKTDTQLAARLRDISLADDIRVFQSRAGNPHAIRSHPTPRLDTIFPFIDFRAAAAALRLPSADLATSYLMVGVPSPQLLRRLLDMAVDGYRPPIDIIESDPTIVALWLHMIEDATGFNDQRVHLFTGKAAVDDHRAFITNTPGRVPPSLILTNHRPPTHWNPPTLSRSLSADLAGAIRTRQTVQRTALDQRLRNRDVAHWQHCFREIQRASGGARRLRIVGFTTRYSTVIQHAMRDLAAAFARKGHVFDIIAQPDDCSAMVDVASALTADHREFDMIVAINHLRFEYADAMPRSVPFVGWIQDHMDHLWKREAGASVGELDLVISHSPHVLASLYGYPLDRVLASSNLTDPHIYDATPLPDDELRPHRCDLSFVSHGAATPEALVDDLGRATCPAFHNLLRCFLKIARSELDRGGCINALRLVELMLQAECDSQHPPLPADVRRAHVYPQVAKIHDRLFRHQTLEWAAAWARRSNKSLRIYGRGWEKHPTLSAFARGEAASGRELRAVYQASKVSLQANAYASLHQRLLDGLACGSCVISRYNPADFVRQPFAAIAHAIASRQMASLDDLVNLRRDDAAFGAICDEAERLSGAVIARVNGRRRQEQMRVLLEANNIPELQTDDGLFAVLRDMRFMPGRVAGDLPGFEQTIFHNEAEMHALLDRLADDDDARHALVEPMRNAVLSHDTFDVLADRIVQAFAGAGRTAA